MTAEQVKQKVIDHLRGKVTGTVTFTTVIPGGGYWIVQTSNPEGKAFKVTKTQVTEF